MIRMCESAKLVIEVTAGLIPERPEDEFTRRYAMTSRQWDDADNKGVALAELNGRATGYAGSLMLQPDRLNWVRTDWVWL